MTPKQLYIQQLLNHHPSTTDTSWSRSRASKRLAAQLYDRGIPLPIVQSAMLLVTARREFRSSDTPPLSPIRTLYYFLPEIEESHYLRQSRRLVILNRSKRYIVIGIGATQGGY